MNKYRTARLVSDEMVVTQAEKNLSSVNLIPAFKDGIEKIKSINVEIRNTMLLQKQSKSGVTDAKKLDHVDLVYATSVVEGALHMYAQSKANKVLLAKVSHSNSDLGHLPFSELIDICNSIVKLANEIPVADLQYYGITSIILANLNTVLKNFNTTKTKPKEETIDHHALTQKIIALQTNSHVILSNLDKLSIQFIKIAPLYYPIYKSSRRSETVSPRKKKTPPTK